MTASMFGSNGLSLPSTFAHEHRPLRITSESARHHPTGECRYEIPHPAPQQQRCSCQSFHHDRTAPGNICECGHKACFHAHEPAGDRAHLNELTGPTSVNALQDKVKRLEEMIHLERRSTEKALQRERQLWEREVRILREAFAPFYKHNEELQAKLREMEDRMEGNYDEQVRLKQRVETLDEVSMAMERKLDDTAGGRAKKRRTRLNPSLDDGSASAMAPGDLRRASSSVDERSTTTPSSRALSPHGMMPTPPEHEEPRSSGILNLVEAHRTVPLGMGMGMGGGGGGMGMGMGMAMPPRALPASEEARSSGFLNLDLSDRMSQKTGSEGGHDSHHASPRGLVVVDRFSPPSYAASLQDSVRTASMTPPELMSVPPSYPKVLEKMRVIPLNGSPKKRKLEGEHIALEVLADVSARETLIR